MRARCRAPVKVRSWDFAAVRGPRDERQMLSKANKSYRRSSRCTCERLTVMRIKSVEAAARVVSEADFSRID